MIENGPKKKKNQELQRIEKALGFAVQYNGIDGAHHKSWVIDQIVRILTGCPTIRQEGTDDVLGKSKKYKELVRKAKEGENGPETYDWDIGIAP